MNGGPEQINRTRRFLLVRIAVWPVLAVVLVQTAEWYPRPAYSGA